ncbi:MAG: cell division FtsA domain-containing protein [Clostridium sp.]|nr:cell division FtsA domain-containing protein [Clostridium sp.]
MISVNVNPEEVIFSLDIGTRTVIGTVGVVRDKKFKVISEKYTEHEQRAMVDGQIHDINLVARAVNKVKTEIEEEIGFELKKVAIAAAGRFLRTTTVKSEINIDEDKEIDKEIIRSLELTAVKIAQEDVNKSTEGKLYCVGYSVKSYYLNGYEISNLLSHKGKYISAEVIATFLPRSVVDSLYAVTNKVSLNVTSLTLEPIAAMEAAVPQNLRLLNLALVDIGAGTSDIAISSNETISAYGMVSVAGDEVTEAIAKQCLGDFNAAEKIKKGIEKKEEVKYVDVIGMENTITFDEVVKITEPVVEKLSKEISTKIIELNAGKAPNAVFLVGGGAHTTTLKEKIAERLSIKPERVAIKGRESVKECICKDNNELGSTGVTVLGIALVAIKKFGGDFIDVFLNNSVVSLFNSKKNTVMDVIIQAGINPKVLLGKNGDNIKFILNGSKRIAFGKIAKSAVIKINGTLGSMESYIKENDKIEIEFAQNGENAKVFIKDYVNKVNSIGFYINDEIKNIDPVFIINSKRVSVESEIHSGDEVTTISVNTIGDYKKYFKENQNLSFYKGGNKLNDNYVINEGDKIIARTEKVESEEPNNEEKELLQNKDNEIEVKESEEKEPKNEVLPKEELMDNGIYGSILNVTVNGDNIVLKGKKKYIFVDIFNFIDFDLTMVKGQITLKLNGNKAGYNDALKDGDNIEIKWEQANFNL